ncbi:MAG: hypothetical protein JWN83_475 [Chitinophagaceae bacterium]|nr:hypothetical protein [Chitinophagaceae bacterium]
MIRPILLISLLFCFRLSLGQTKTLTGIVSSNGDTSFSYKYQLKKAEKLSLPLLDTSSYNKYYRIWSDRQVIDLWQNINGAFSGRLTTWADEYVSNKEEPTYRSFIVIKKLSDDTIKLLMSLINISNILSLPSDDSIKGWRRGFDGITYIIEQSSKENYSFKTYWTPRVQDSLKEAKQVQEFIDSIFFLTNAPNILKEFSKAIPYECYFNGGIGVACKILTKKERKKYVRERKNYRKKYLKN